MYKCWWWLVLLGLGVDPRYMTASKWESSRMFWAKNKHIFETIYHVAYTWIYRHCFFFNNKRVYMQIYIYIFKNREVYHVLEKYIVQWVMSCFFGPEDQSTTAGWNSDLHKRKESSQKVIEQLQFKVHHSNWKKSLVHHLRDLFCLKYSTFNVHIISMKPPCFKHKKAVSISVKAWLRLHLKTRWIAKIWVLGPSKWNKQRY